MRARSMLASAAAVLLTVTAGAVFPAATSAAASQKRVTVTLPKGTYDCYDVDGWIGMPLYSGVSVRLGTRGVYVAGMRHVAIDHPVAGKYAIANKKVTFRSGPLKAYYGKVMPRDPWYGLPYFSLYLAKKKKSISRVCIATRNTNKQLAALS
jgi:hypothetical protein